MPAGKITRFFKCESLHCVENPMWKNADYQADVQACPCCEIETKPYRIICRGRLYGHYRCRGTTKSCGKYWTSAYAFCGRWQQCTRCKEKVEPYLLRELDKKKAHGPPKPHCEALCEICKDLKKQGIFTGCQNYSEEAEMDLKNKKEKSAAKIKPQKKTTWADALLDRAGYRDRRKAIEDFEAFHSMNIRLHEQEISKQKAEIKAELAKIKSKMKSEPKTDKNESQSSIATKAGVGNKIEEIKSELGVDKQNAEAQKEPAKVVKKKRKSKRNKDESKSKIVTPAISEPTLEAEKASGIKDPDSLCPEKEQKKKLKRKQKKKSKSVESEKTQGDNPKQETGMRFPFSKKLEYKVEKYEEKTDKGKA